MNFLKIDSPLMKRLAVMADLLILNFWTLLFCLPVITAGASFTAMHYVLLKIVRGEESYVTGQFFKAFKKNFLQATILWIIMLAVYAVLFVDWRILRMQGDQFPGYLLILLGAAAMVIFLLSLYVFPILSRYENTVLGTIKAAFTMSVIGIVTLRTIGMGLAMFIPLLFLWAGGYPVVPVFLCFCFSFPGWLRALMYNGLFRTYEGVAGMQKKEEGDDLYRVPEEEGAVEEEEAPSEE